MPLVLSESCQLVDTFSQVVTLSVLVLESPRGVQAWDSSPQPCKLPSISVSSFRRFFKSNLDGILICRRDLGFFQAVRCYMDRKNLVGSAESGQLIDAHH